jgi:Zinc knuckle
MNTNDYMILCETLEGMFRETLHDTDLNVEVKETPQHGNLRLTVVVFEHRGTEGQCRIGLMVFPSMAGLASWAADKIREQFTFENGYDPERDMRNQVTEKATTSVCYRCGITGHRSRECLER